MHKTKGKIRRRLMPVTARKFYMKSRSKNDGTRYEVTVSHAGVLHCSCPAMVYRPGQLCVHARRALEYRQRHEEQMLAEYDPGFEQWSADKAAQGGAL